MFLHWPFFLLVAGPKRGPPTPGFSISIRLCISLFVCMGGWGGRKKGAGEKIQKNLNYHASYKNKTKNYIYIYLYTFKSRNLSNLYWAYYPHRSRELVSPVCVIFSKSLYWQFRPFFHKSEITLPKQFFPQWLFFCFLLETPGCLETCVFGVTNCSMPKPAMV